MHDTQRTGNDLAGHVAIVTGANHGIGAATAQALARAGAAVFVTFLRIRDRPDPGIPHAYYRNRARDAQTVVEEIRTFGGRAASLEIDLAEADAAVRVFDAAERELGPVDILVNNATGWLADSFTGSATDPLGRGLERVSAASIRRQFAVDVEAAALLIAELGIRHRARGIGWGRIVSLSSGGPDGFPGEVSYGAAKAALENYTMSAAYELAPLGITANVVHPPVTDTGWVTDAVRARVAADPKLIHIARPAEVGEAIASLISERTSLMTGNVIHLR